MFVSPLQILSPLKTFLLIFFLLIKSAAHQSASWFFFSIDIAMCLRFSGIWASTATFNWHFLWKRFKNYYLSKVLNFLYRTDWSFELLKIFLSRACRHNRTFVTKQEKTLVWTWMYGTQVLINLHFIFNYNTL